MLLNSLTSSQPWKGEAFIFYVKEIIGKYDKNAKVEITNKGKYTEIKVKSEKYCDKARIWISLHELFKDRNDVIIEVE